MDRLDPLPNPTSAGRDRAAPRTPLRLPRAFTLVELLVVIAIIGMLAAIVSVAVVRALDTAKQTRMKTEVDQIDSALKAYKEKYGSYPPCDLQTPAGNAALRQHVARAFPRYNLADLVTDLPAAGVDTANFRPDQALVFWLRGFSNDPLHPFVTLQDEKIVSGASSGQKVTLSPLHGFDTTRLIALSLAGTPTVPSYFPAGVAVSSTPSTAATSPFPEWSSGGAPYVYFDAANYQVTAPVQAGSMEAMSREFNTLPTPFYTDAGLAVPYWLDANGNSFSAQAADFDTGGSPTEDWANPESFQIIATGQDGKYGSSAAAGALVCRKYPTGGGYDTSTNLADDDNVTNFCGSARLEAAKP